MYKLYQINSPKNRTETGLLENLHFDEKRDVICLHKKTPEADHSGVFGAD